MTININQAVRIGGVPTTGQVTLSADAEADLVARGVASYVAGNPSVRRREPLRSGQWEPAPSLFRLRLVGSGSCVVDARDILGTVTANVATLTAASATNQIEFPYLGDAATEIRCTFPATLTVEVLP